MRRQFGYLRALLRGVLKGAAPDPVPKVVELIYKLAMRNLRQLGLVTFSSALISTAFLNIAGCADGEPKQPVDPAVVPVASGNASPVVAGAVPGVPGTVPGVTSDPLYEMSGKPKVVVRRSVVFDVNQAQLVWGKLTDVGTSQCVLLRRSEESKELPLVVLDPGTALIVRFGLVGIEVDQQLRPKIWQVFNLESENRARFRLRCEKNISDYSAAFVTSAEFEKITEGSMMLEDRSADASGPKKMRWNLEGTIPADDQLFASVSPGSVVRVNDAGVEKSRGMRAHASDWKSEWQDGVASGESLLDKGRLRAEVRLSAKNYTVEKTKIFYFLNFESNEASYFEIILDLGGEGQKSFIEWTLPLTARAPELQMEMHAFLTVFPGRSIQIVGQPLPFNLKISD